MRDNVFQELRPTIHYANRSGVRATCPDCHVPHNWTDKIGRKMQASKEASGEKTCIDCHKGIAHHLPNMGQFGPSN